jgi:UDP-2,3-diacylglucosamine pyrophosphatase LpxH
MLVIISDLHFVDGTAGEHNVPADAFTIFFEGLKGNVERLLRKNREVKEIKIVFLGDIFDLLRTEAWFEPVPENERPWGTRETKIREHANSIFDKILHANKATFELLGGSLKKRFGFHVEPERVYIPGNHDRLCNKYPSLRKKVCKNLGIKSSGKPFENYFEDTDYGVFARHGHEYDTFNFEGATSYRYEDYMRMPIGDPITTELVARLPWEIMRQPAVKKLPKVQQAALRRNFQEIENVRPFSATLEWLLYQIRENISIKEAIEDSVDTVIRGFNALKYVKKWYEHHDKWIDFMDTADEIQSVLYLLEKFKVFSSERLMPYIERVKDWFSRDDLLEGATTEYSHLDSRIRYVVFGHTHEPAQVPIRVINTPAGLKEQIYLNTGTWRTRYYKCRERFGFVGWKNLTYTVFYTKEERGLDFPAFSTWTGTLKTI